MSSIQLPVRFSGVAFVVAGILILVGGQLHPRADTSLEPNAALAALLADSLWRVDKSLLEPSLMLVDR